MSEELELKIKNDSNLRAALEKIKTAAKNTGKELTNGQAYNIYVRSKQLARDNYDQNF